MRRQPTTPILVLAILHLVGGGLGLLFSFCGCAGLFAMSALGPITMPTLATRPGQPPPPPMPPGPNEVMTYMNEHVPAYRAFTIGNLALSFVLDILLISAGIGLLKMQNWARWLSLIYATLSILFHVGSFVYQLVWVVPATNALYSKATAAMPGGLSSIVALSTGIGAFFQLLIVLYPIAVFIILLLPSTGAALRGEIPVREDDLRADEESDDDSWREPPRSDRFTR